MPSLLARLAKWKLHLGLVLGSVSALSACSQPAAAPTAQAEPWPQADQLFQRDASWLGADDAYSIALGGGRVLWLFADGFIATSPARLRSASKFIRNSVAVSSGLDPTTATIHFSYRTSGGKPASFFPEVGDAWFWPGHGVRLGSGLLLFLMRVRPSSGGLGFAVDGSVAQWIENPDDDPLTWRSRGVPFTPATFATIGAGGVLATETYVYAYSPREPGNHDIFLVRFPRERAGVGDLSQAEWWTAAGWTPAGSLAGEPQVLFPDGQAEFTVHHDALRGEYVAVLSQGFGSTDIIVRAAPAPEGPWSQAGKVYRPPESDRAGTLVYAAKAHPELTGADVVLTYVANHTDFATVVSDMSLYFPRFVRLHWTAP